MRYNTSRIFPLFASQRERKAGQNSPTSAESSCETQFLRTWFEYDSEVCEARQFNRGTIVGILIVFAISGGFWTGVGILASRLLR